MNLLPLANDNSNGRPFALGVDRSREHENPHANNGGYTNSVFGRPQSGNTTPAACSWLYTSRYFRGATSTATLSPSLIRVGAPRPSTGSNGYGRELAQNDRGTKRPSGLEAGEQKRAGSRSMRDRWLSPHAGGCALIMRGITTNSVARPRCSRRKAGCGRPLAGVLQAPRRPANFPPAGVPLSWWPGHAPAGEGLLHRFSHEIAAAPSGIRTQVSVRWRPVLRALPYRSAALPRPIRDAEKAIAALLPAAFPPLPRR